MKKLATMLAFAGCVALCSFADGKTLVWNGTDGASWTSQSWLDGDTPSEWIDGANAEFPSAASVSISGTVAVSKLTTSDTLALAGTVASTYEGFVPSENAVLAFPGLTLADISAVKGEMGGSSMNNGSRTFSALGYHFYPENGKATVQFQVNQGSIKCVIVEFSDGVGGVYAKAIKACYVDDPKITTLGMDLVSGNVLKVRDQKTATSLATSGYGVSQLKASVARLQLTGETSLGGALSATDTEILVTAPISQTWTQKVSTSNAKIAIRGLFSETTDKTFGITDSSVSGAAAQWLTANASDTVFTNMVLARTSPVKSIMRGTAIGYNANANPYHIRFDGQTMTFQLQFWAGGIKGVKVELKQNGADVTARRVAGWWYDQNKGATQDMVGLDLEAKQAELGTSVIANNTGSYGVKSLTLRTVDVPSVTMKVANSCTDAVVDNAQVVFGHKDAIPKNYIVRNSAQVVYKGTYGSSNSNYGMARLFRSGSDLLFAQGLIAEGQAVYSFDACTFHNWQYHNTNKDGNNYINNLALANGSAYHGNSIRTGYGNFTNETTITSSGSSSNTINSGINMLAHHLGNMRFQTNTLAIATAADLTISGQIYDYPDTAYRGACIVKRGDAKLTLSGDNTFAGRLTLEAGTLELGSNTALPSSAPLTLAEGTLLVGGNTIATGTLTISGNATISIASGSLAFSDSSAEEWTQGAVLNITGPSTLPAQALRFGTNASGLTASQLASIRYNGERVLLDDNGYLKPCPKGTVVSLL